MLYPTGLAAFAQAYPERTFDVGIAEQHALTSAAGLAAGGLHPVVALYSTFLNRAFDQLLMDVALHRHAVTLVLDRAGITGSDGPSHNGMWDLSILGIVPGMRVAAPRDEPTLRAALREAVAHETGPTAVRFPKGALSAELPVLRTVDGTVDVLFENYGEDPDVDILVVAAGPLAAAAVEGAASIAEEGWSIRVVAPTWIRPVPQAVLDLAGTAELVVTVEDGGLSGGFGDWLAQALRADCGDRPVLTLGLAQEFLEIGKRADVLAESGLDADGIARSMRTRMAALHAAQSGEHRDEEPAHHRQDNVVNLAHIDTRRVDPATRFGPS